MNDMNTSICQRWTEFSTDIDSTLLHHRCLLVPKGELIACLNAVSDKPRITATVVDDLEPVPNRMRLSDPRNVANWLTGALNVLMARALTRYSEAPSDVGDEYTRRSSPDATTQRLHGEQ